MVPLFFKVTVLAALGMPDVCVPKESMLGERLIRLSVSTETLLSLVTATAISSLPLLLKSPTARPAGPPPVGNTDCDLKVPSALPTSVETVLSLKLAAIRSTLPSEFKSAAATITEFAPIP